MNAPPQTDGLIEFDNQPPQAEIISDFFMNFVWNFRLIFLFWIFLKNKINFERLNHHQNWNQWQQTNHFVQKCLNNGLLIELLLVSRKDFRYFAIFALKLSFWADRLKSGKCEQRTQLNTFCRAFCLNKSHVFVPGSLQTAQCRGRHIRFAVMPKGHKPFARCGAPDQVQGLVFAVMMTHILWLIFSPEAGDNDISVGRCGSIRDKKWKMTIGDNVSMNCNGSRCFPGCKDPNKVRYPMSHRLWVINDFVQSPTTPVLECVKRGRRSTMTPFFANTQCVGESCSLTHIIWVIWNESCLMRNE